MQKYLKEKHRRADCRFYRICPAGNVKRQPALSSASTCFAVKGCLPSPPMNCTTRFIVRGLHRSLHHAKTLLALYRVLIMAHVLTGYHSTPFIGFESAKHSSSAHSLCFHHTLHIGKKRMKPAGSVQSAQAGSFKGEPYKKDPTCSFPLPCL